LPILIGGFPILGVANIDCGMDFGCVKKALSNCNTGLVKFTIDQPIENMNLKGLAEMTLSKTGSNLCDIGINLTDIKSTFDQATTKKYKESNLSDAEVNQLANGFRRNKQISGNSYKKCVFKVERIASIFQEAKDLINVRISDDCSDVIATTNESTKTVDTEKIAPESINNSAKDKVTESPVQPSNSKDKTSDSNTKMVPKADSEKKIIESINATIMGQGPSKIYQEKIKNGMTNEQIGQEAINSFFSHLKKCDGNACEKMTCENCSKGVLFCAKQGYCMECYSDSAGDCKSGFECLMGICKKRMTIEDFLKL
jgi:hypothetical protein